MGAFPNMRRGSDQEKSGVITLLTCKVAVMIEKGMYVNSKHTLTCSRSSVTVGPSCFCCLNINEEIEVLTRATCFSHHQLHTLFQEVQPHDLIVPGP